MTNKKGKSPKETRSRQGVVVKNTTEVCQKVSYGIQPANIIQLVACGKFT